MKKLSNSFVFTCLCLFLFSCGSQTTTSSPSDFVDGVATALQNGGNVDLIKKRLMAIGHLVPQQDSLPSAKGQ